MKIKNRIILEDLKMSLYMALTKKDFIGKNWFWLIYSLIILMMCIYVGKLYIIVIGCFIFSYEITKIVFLTKYFYNKIKGI